VDMEAQHKDVPRLSRGAVDKASAGMAGCSVA
jgi:hypothetical protein